MPTPLSGTTEKNFSVDKYFELQEKKLELEAKQRAGDANTVFDGSSVLSTDGGIPLDYEEGELEDEGTSSSQSYDSKPAAGTRRPVKMIRTLLLRSVREVDAVPSTLEALSITSDPPVVLLERCDAPRTKDSVREPWMPSEGVTTARNGCTVLPNVIPLYVDNRIDDAEAASKHFEPMTNQRRGYYISLFHELRYWSSKKTSGQSRVPKWQALCQSWNQFVENFSKDSTAYRFRSTPLLLSFNAFTRFREREHSLCSAGGRSLPALSPWCSPHQRERHHRELRAKLACTRQLPSVVPEHNTPQNTAPRSVTPPVRGGLRTPSPFPERPSSGRFGEITYLEGDPIVSNEKNEPDLGSSLDWYGQQSDPPRGGSYRGQSYVSVGGAGRSSYGQPQVDHGLQALHARVEALECVQALQIAELKQQLNMQKAYVAEAAQTTSNIRVKVSEQVHLLPEKVKRLEEKLKSRRASSSASHHD
ncbi:LOW QUALITY PROTEIN: hypothetical protein PHMEG_00014035 [Phytophthora megakarya]|uniref:Uncharacterized protein n=1 Tax=Phytophthora megakarya TaxID=4795 RepID=A0A225W6G7_9STRA|nr:LOW QUALITY PROTEIN: hypothetical protein PHMEG_00014035 [Phytophthora megakarya]